MNILILISLWSRVSIFIELIRRCVIGGPKGCLFKFFIETIKLSFFKNLWASLVAQWLGICLPTQGTRVQALVQEDPTCCGATKPMRHNYWARVPQLLKPVHLEPVLRNKRSPCNEKPGHRNQEKPPLAATRESPSAATKTQHSQK